MEENNNINNNYPLFIRINDFDGPIDLLYNLIKEKKFDILNIDLLYISLEYVSYVKDNIYKMKIDDITENLSMITYFFEFKSKKILNKNISNEKIENEMADDKFIQRILLQKQFRDLVPNLSKRMINRNKMFSKDFDNIQDIDLFNEELPESISPNIILKAMQNIFKKINKNQNNIINIEINELSIEDITNEIMDFLLNLPNNEISLFDLLLAYPSNKINRQYLAVAFVALLVLVRNGHITLFQDMKNENNIIIKRIYLNEK